MIAKFRIRFVRRRGVITKLAQFLRENEDEWIKCRPVDENNVSIIIDGKSFKVPSMYIKSAINDERKYYKVCNFCKSLNPNWVDVCRCNSNEFVSIVKNPLSKNIMKEIVQDAFGI